MTFDNDLDKLAFCYGLTSIMQGQYIWATNDRTQHILGQIATQSLDKLTALLFSEHGDLILEQMKIASESHANGLRCFVLDFYQALFTDDLPIQQALEQVRKKREEPS